MKPRFELDPPEDGYKARAETVQSDPRQVAAFVAATSPGMLERLNTVLVTAIGQSARMSEPLQFILDVSDEAYRTGDDTYAAELHTLARRILDGARARDRARMLDQKGGSPT